MLGQMIFDLRTPQEKETDRLHGFANNFLIEKNIWKERPSLVKSDLVELHKHTKIQSIHQLKSQG